MRMIPHKAPKGCLSILLTIFAWFLMTPQFTPQTAAQDDVGQPRKPTVWGPPPKQGAVSVPPAGVPPQDPTPPGTDGGRAPERPRPPIIIIPGPNWPPQSPPPITSSKPDLEKLLSEKGPQFPEIYSMSRFLVHGFVKGDWPMVVDYELEQAASLVWITIAAEGVDPFYYRLDGTKRGRQEVILRLPARFGDKPQVGLYSIRAFGNDVGELRPVNFRIYGLGAGDKAVGSVGIDQLRFQPGNIRPNQNEKASYNFHSLFDFNKVAAEFMLVGLSPSREIIAKLVNSEKIKNGVRRDAWVNKEWNGKNEKGNVSNGQHQLHVRAWRGRESGGDWVAAWSAQLVRVQ